MKQKIDRHFEKYIQDNFSKSDKRKNDDIKFEWFINSMIAWKISTKSYNTIRNIGKEISLGSSEGIDAFFIVIGDNIYSINTDINEILESKKDDNKVEIKFVFIQTKNTKSVHVGDFHSFINIPKAVFNNEDTSSFSNKITELKDFINTITEYKFKDVSYSINLYFCSKKNDTEITSLNQDWSSYITNAKGVFADYFENVEIYLIGSQYLSNLYEKYSSNNLELCVDKEKLNCIFSDETSECHIGYITAKELLDAIAPIANNERALHPDAFKNNIRLYLGATDINKGIENTILNDYSKFHLYNNGITITTKSICKINMDSIKITPINIVNGCQTANSIFKVLSSNKSIDENKILIPVKIISIKTDDNITNSITIRSNSQNGVSEKELISITDMQIEIESLFSKLKLQDKIFRYQRQTSENNSANADSDFIIEISDILRTIFSTILQGTHLVSSKFEVTTKKYLASIFKEEIIQMYVILTALYSFVEEYLENNQTDLSVRLKYIVTYLIYRMCVSDNNYRLLNKYVKNKRIKGEEKLLSDIKENKTEIYSTIYKVISTADNFELVINYVIDRIKAKYPEYLDLGTKQKERVLYLSPVNKFSNFSLRFTKNIDDIINNK